MIPIRIRKTPILKVFYHLQFLDKAMQEELHRIKSSTMRKKSTDKTHPGSFIQTITDRLSDAKVNCEAQPWKIWPQTFIWSEHSHYFLSISVAECWNFITILQYKQVQGEQLYKLWRETDRQTQPPRKLRYVLKMPSLYDGSHIHWDTYIYNITLYKINIPDVPVYN